MAIHVTSINGMGASTLLGSTITNTGMKAEDHMHFSQDFVTGGIVSIDRLDCQVAQNGVANMTINVAAGTIYVPNSAYAENSTSQQKFFRLVNDGSESVIITANASGNPRITSIFAKINVGATPDDNATNIGSFVAIDGTPAASPTAPSAPADGNSYERIANIAVANGASSIVTANITDTRRQISVLNVSGQEGFLINGQITRTVASNNITYSIKTLAGNDPSVTEPVMVRVNNVLRRITAALTLTINSGTNWFNAGASELATNEIDYFVYLGYRAASSTVFLAVSRISWGNTYADFSGTSTNDRYLSYSGSAPASTDSLVVIGRVNATLSATASFNWSVPATSLIINRPIFETRVLTWAPTLTGFSANPASAIYRYQLVGRKCFLNIRQGNTGTSNATSFTLTAPMTSLTLTNGQWGGLFYVASDNGAALTAPGRIYIIQASTTITVGKDLSSDSNWTAANGKRINVDLIYEI